jgi:hypothetical protein
VEGGTAVSKEPPDYLAYQLRLWRASEGGGAVWRASLTSSRTRERESFANLDELFDFLRQQTGASLEPEDEKERSER